MSFYVWNISYSEQAIMHCTETKQFSNKINYRPPSTPMDKAHRCKLQSVCQRMVMLSVASAFPVGFVRQLVGEVVQEFFRFGLD